MLATDTSATQGKTQDEIRQDRIQKYRDIMDIKGMNKTAAYDSLIAASQAVNQAGGDLKGAIKDGSLINQVIQSTSKAFDKPKQTKDIWIICPVGIPIKCGSVLKKPNFIAEAVNIALLGPGVTNIIK